MFGRFALERSCYCTSKTRKSESKSQRVSTTAENALAPVVIALVKLENLKANHNSVLLLFVKSLVVIALVKLENLKANHNNSYTLYKMCAVVIALVKLENLKANHNEA